MSIEIACPQCGTAYEADQKDIGRSIVCETCGKSFTIRPRTAKLDISMTPQNKAEPQAFSNCGSGGQRLPLWISVGVLVLNFAALVVLCFYSHKDLHEINVSTVVLEKKLKVLEENVDALGDKMGGITEELKHMDKSRHHDAEQIFDRMGRMKLY